MTDHYNERKVDGRLLPFLNASSDAGAKQALDALFKKDVKPAISRAVRRHFRGYRTDDSTPDGEDAHLVQIDSVRTLVREFWQVRHGEKHPVRDIDALVFLVVANTYRSYLRHKYPERDALSEGYRKLLGGESERCRDFSLWRKGKAQLCGFKAWEGQGRATDGTTVRTYEEVVRNPEKILHLDIPCSLKLEPKLIVVATGVFNTIRSPVDLRDLITVATQVLGMTDEVARAHSTLATTDAEGELYDLAENQPDTGSSPLDALSEQEIC